MADLTNLDAANLALQRDTKAAKSTKNFGLAAANAIHAVDADADVAAIRPPATGNGLTGILDAQRDLGYNPTQGDISSKLQAAIPTLPVGSVVHFGPGIWTFAIDVSGRPDLGWQGVPSGAVGNFETQAGMTGTYVRPPSGLTTAVFRVAPANLSQVGPTFRWLKGYFGDFTSYDGDFVYVRNCNNGVIEHVGGIYCRSVIHADGGDDNAWWQVTDVRSFHCAHGVWLSANLGWEIDKVVGYAAEGQWVIHETNFAQNNRIAGISTDGMWNDVTAAVVGGSILCDFGAHNNHHLIRKLEATNPAVMLRTPADASVSPTRANVFEGGVVGGRYGKTVAFDIGLGVDQTYIGDLPSYVNGPTDPKALILDKGTNTRLPARLILG